MPLDKKPKKAPVKPKKKAPAKKITTQKQRQTQIVNVHLGTAKSAKPRKASVAKSASSIPHIYAPQTAPQQFDYMRFADIINRPAPAQPMQPTKKTAASATSQTEDYSFPRNEVSMDDVYDGFSFPDRQIHDINTTLNRRLSSISQMSDANMLSPGEERDQMGAEEITGKINKQKRHNEDVFDNSVLIKDIAQKQIVEKGKQRAERTQMGAEDINRSVKKRVGFNVLPGEETFTPAAKQRALTQKQKQSYIEARMSEGLTKYAADKEWKKKTVQPNLIDTQSSFGRTAQVLAATSDYPLTFDAIPREPQTNLTIGAKKAADNEASQIMNPIINFQI